MAYMHYWPLIPSVVFIILFYYLRAIRWRFLLPHEEERTSAVHMFDSHMVCNLENHLVPLRGGELIRQCMLLFKNAQSYSNCFASVVVQRFFMDLADWRDYLASEDEMAKALGMKPVIEVEDGRIYALQHVVHDDD